MRGALVRDKWVWAGIALVILLLYLPMIPPLLFSLAPETPNEGGLTLRWYGEMWKHPLLTEAMATSLEAGIIVAVEARPAPHAAAPVRARRQHGPCGRILL